MTSPSLTLPSARSRIGLATAVLAVVALGGGCASASRVDPEVKVFELRGGVLDVRSDAPTALVASDRDDVEVTRWFDKRFATGVETRWELTDGVLELSAACSGIANCDARFTVKVPAHVVVLRDGRTTELDGAGR